MFNNGMHIAEMAQFTNNANIHPASESIHMLNGVFFAHDPILQEP